MTQDYSGMAGMFVGAAARLALDSGIGADEWRLLMDLAWRAVNMPVDEGGAAAGLIIAGGEMLRDALMDQEPEP